MKKLLAKIAAKHLFIETLEARNRDCLEFYEVPVWGIEAALKEAYEAGRASTK